MDSSRRMDVQSGIRIELLSLLWMLVEMAVSLAAGIAARSLLLTAFGIDSLIELVSAGILLWRLEVEGRGGSLERTAGAERVAGRIVAVSLALLCLYVLSSSVYGLINRLSPESSLLGIGVSAAAVVIMIYLAVSKRRIAGRIHSEALAGDAINSVTCACMAGTVLVGLLLNAIFGWWWVENAAALLFLVWLVRETVETFQEAFEKAQLHDPGGSG